MMIASSGAGACRGSSIAVWNCRSRLWHPSAQADETGEPGLVAAAFSSLALLVPRQTESSLTISGFSMGVRGAWVAAEQSLVSRALIVAGRTAPALLSAPVPATQIKIVHGAVDDHQPASEMRDFYGHASRIGVAIEYEELPGKGHFIADEAYKWADVIDWLTI